MSASPSTNRVTTRVSGGSDEGGTGSRKRTSSNNSYDSKLYETGTTKRKRKEAKEKGTGRKNAGGGRGHGKHKDRHHQHHQHHQHQHQHQQYQQLQYGYEDDESTLDGGGFDSDSDAISDGDGEPVLLTTVDPDSWVGQRVRVQRTTTTGSESNVGYGTGIGVGNPRGMAGTVVKSGNGWVQVLLPNGEEVAKRAYELELARNGSSSSSNRRTRNSRASSSYRNAVATGTGADNAAAIAFSNIGVGSYGKTTTSAVPSLHINMSSIRKVGDKDSGVGHPGPGGACRGSGFRDECSRNRPRSFSEPMLTPTSSYYGVQSPKLFFLSSSPRPAAAAANGSTGGTGIPKTFSFSNAEKLEGESSSGIGTGTDTSFGTGGGSTASGAESVVMDATVNAGVNSDNKKGKDAVAVTASDAASISKDPDSGLEVATTDRSTELSSSGANPTNSGPSTSTEKEFANQITRSATVKNTTVTSSAIGAEGGTLGETSKRCYIKKANPLLIQARREWTQKYVAKTQEKIEKRPDLAYWKRAITSSIMVDPAEELRISRRDAEDPTLCCPCCRMERWNGGLFCWNEKCRISPIYWKLPGARGVPPVPTVPQALTTVDPLPSSLEAMAQQIENDTMGVALSQPFVSEIPPNSESPSTTTAVFSAANSAETSSSSGKRMGAYNEDGDVCMTTEANGTHSLKIPPLFDYSYNSNTNTSSGDKRCAISLLNNNSSWAPETTAVSAGGTNSGHGSVQVVNKENSVNATGSPSKAAASRASQSSSSRPQHPWGDQYATGGSNLFYHEVRHEKLPCLNPVVTEDMNHKPLTQYIAGTGGVSYRDSGYHQQATNTNSVDSAGERMDGVEGGNDDNAVTGASSGSVGESASHSQYLSNDMINHMRPHTSISTAAVPTHTKESDCVAENHNSNSNSTQLDRYQKSLVFTSIDSKEEQGQVQDEKDEEAKERFLRTRFQV